VKKTVHHQILQHPRFVGENVAATGGPRCLKYGVTGDYV
jgi:hypothetical protein